MRDGLIGEEGCCSRDEPEKKFNRNILKGYAGNVCDGGGRGGGGVEGCGRKQVKGECTEGTARNERIDKKRH